MNKLKLVLQSQSEVRSDGANPATVEVVHAFKLLEALLDEFQMIQQRIYNRILLSQQFFVSTTVLYTFTSYRWCRVIEHVSSDPKSVLGSIILHKLCDSLEAHNSRLTHGRYGKPFITIIMNQLM